MKQQKKNPIIDQLEEWQRLQDLLQKTKREEMDLRISICEELTNELGTGTHNFVFEYLKVKVTKKNNVNINKELFFASELNMTPEELRCVRMNPELKAKEYKELQKMVEEDAESSSGLLDECITVTPATPTLELKTVED